MLYQLTSDVSPLALYVFKHENILNREMSRHLLSLKLLHQFQSTMTHHHDIQTIVQPFSVLWTILFGDRYDLQHVEHLAIG